MKKIYLFAVLFLFIAANLNAQSTTLTLPTADNTSNFNITNSSPTNLFYVGGTGKIGVQQTNPRAQLEVGGYNGILSTGTINSGDVLAPGAGPRFMWYPRTGAFRVGVAESSWWDDDGTVDSKLGKYSIAMGYQPRATKEGSVAIGFQNHATGKYALALGSFSFASGTNAIAIGAQATASGIYSIAIGNSVDTNEKEGAVVLVDNTYMPIIYASADNQFSTRFTGGYRFFTNADLTIGTSLAAGGNSWVSISDSTKKENMIKVDGEYFLNSLSKLTLGSWNYKTQNPELFRHYGPMAQEIFHYFGKDEIGVIGNDTTLASADMAGIMMICLQALEKRTKQFKTELAENEGKWKLVNEELRKENNGLKNEIVALL